MKFLKILMGIMLISIQAFASGNVEIHFNYPEDVVYTGATNTMEIWI